VYNMAMQEVVKPLAKPELGLTVAQALGYMCKGRTLRVVARCNKMNSMWKSITSADYF
jgi:hypothetical protein